MGVDCPYCNDKDVPMVTGKEIYPHRKDLWKKKFFRCEPCKAYVGCHRDGRPLGRLANRYLRRWKIKAHEVFDPLWKSGEMKRQEAYNWLAEKLGIPVEECHMGMFDSDMCKRVYVLMQPDDYWVQRKYKEYAIES